MRLVLELHHLHPAGRALTMAGEDQREQDPFFLREVEYGGVHRLEHAG
ncbi:MAG: hypothetical protein U1E76_25250 [Planctomycetota bacterium]